MPIYYKKLPTSETITMEALGKLPKIGCATLLMRSWQCPVDSRGKNISIENNTKLAPHQLVERGIVREAPGEYS